MKTKLSLSFFLAFLLLHTTIQAQDSGSWFQSVKSFFSTENNTTTTQKDNKGTISLAEAFNPTSRKERSHIRTGNDDYASGKFSEAEVNYIRSLNANAERDLDPATYNLGNALFKQGRYDEAMEKYKIATEKLDDRAQKASAYHNMGNSLLRMHDGVEEPQQKYELLKQSVDAYKSALRNVPNNKTSQYNLAYAKKLMEQYQEEEQEKKQCDNPKESDQNQEQKEEQEKKEQKDQEQQKQEEQEKKEEQQKQEEQEKKEEQQQQEEQEKKEEEQQPQPKEGEEDEQKEEEQQPQPKEGEEDEQKEEEPQPQPQPEPQQGEPEQKELTKEDAARLLEALKNEELKVQQKLKRQKGKSRRIRIEKDW